ncbi:hypothetical protein HK105_205485 [Polyrhizophydium stewartii]|uniref:Arrestin C-terminal-like domain-containing protein n=1 Tax=Polyrhizophydium stewartii TaxID=2732419 RepID=A0ABR4N5Z5_9FUNG
MASILKLATDRDCYAPGDLVNLVCTLHNVEIVTGLQLAVRFSRNEALFVTGSDGAQAHTAGGISAHDPPKASFSAETPLQSIVLWQSHMPSGTLLHPKPRSFAAQFVVPLDATPSVTLTDYSKAFIRYVFIAELTAVGGQRFRGACAIPVARPTPADNPPLSLVRLPKDFVTFAVEASLTLDKSVYKVGEPIHLELRVINDDRREVRGVRVLLEEVRNAHFLPEISRTTILASATPDGAVEPGSNKTFSIMLDPKDSVVFAPSTVSGCVQVEHFIRIHISPAAMFLSALVFSVPIDVAGRQRT